MNFNYYLFRDKMYDLYLIILVTRFDCENLNDVSTYLIESVSEEEAILKLVLTHDIGYYMRILSKLVKSEIINDVNYDYKGNAKFIADLIYNNMRDDYIKIIKIK